MTRVRKILAVLALLAAFRAAPAQTVNCIVAVVNGQIITLLDVDVVAAFRLAAEPAAEPGADPRRAALEALIDRKLILDLAREDRPVSADEIARALADLRRSLGEETFRAGLTRFGLTPRDLAPYLEDGLLCERALALRFSQSIPVSVTEVERHYRDIYVPEQARAGAPVEPLDKVTAAIESRIRGDRRTIQTAAWVRDLRRNADIQIKKDCLK